MRKDVLVEGFGRLEAGIEGDERLDHLARDGIGNADDAGPATAACSMSALSTSSSAAE
jgi:hypothetical protein